MTYLFCYEVSWRGADCLMIPSAEATLQAVEYDSVASAATNLFVLEL